MKKVRFDRMGMRGGEVLYALRIDGKLVRQGLTMEEVLRLITQQEDLELKAADRAIMEGRGETPPPLPDGFVERLIAQEPVEAGP